VEGRRLLRSRSPVAPICRDALATFGARNGRCAVDLERAICARVARVYRSGRSRTCNGRDGERRQVLAACRVGRIDDRKRPEHDKAACRHGVTMGQREGETMPLYLSRFSYTPETWARLIGNPEDRRKAAESYIESVGGKLHGFWYAFGTHDGYNLWEAPDNVSMAAVALAISSGGALSSFETTILLTVDETIDALRKVEQVRYRAPGA
jgi:uncharacterized protein with GYD domain